MALIEAVKKNLIQMVGNDDYVQDERYGAKNFVAQSTEAARGRLITDEIQRELSTIDKSDNSHEISAEFEQLGTVTTTEDFTFNNDFSPSATFSATLFTLAYSFSLPSPYRIFSNEGQVNENVFTRWQKKFNMKMRDAGKAIATEEDQIYINNALNPRRTQVLADADLLSDTGVGSTYAFNVGTDELDVNRAAYQDNFFLKMDELMQANFMNQGGLIFNKLGMTNALSEIIKFGGANQQDQQNSLNMPFPMFATPNIDQSTDQFVAFAAEFGSVGSITNIPPIYRTNETTYGPMGQINFTTFDGGVPYYENTSIAAMHRRMYADNSGIDATGSSHATVDILDSWKLIRKFWVITSFNPDLATNQNDIIKIRGSKT